MNVMYIPLNYIPKSTTVLTQERDLTPRRRIASIGKAPAKGVKAKC